MAFCAYCGNLLPEFGTFCPTCGKSPGSAATPNSSAAKPAVAKEHIFLEDQGILITNARFIADGTTYAMSSITSVQQFMVPVKHKGPLILIALGAVEFFGSFLGQGGPGTDAGTIVVVILIGLLLMGLGVMWIARRYRNAVYGVLLYTASGQREALRRRNKDLIGSVVTALNEAIVQRG